RCFGFSDKLLEGDDSYGTAQQVGPSFGSLIMKHRFILSPSRLGWLSATGLTTTLFNVAAQTPPPPPLPPPVSAEEEPPIADEAAPSPVTEASPTSTDE